MFRFIVMLEGEPSAQSEVLNALDWVFIKAISIFWCIELFFYSDESLSPCPLKNNPIAWGCYQHTLLLGWNSAGNEQSWFPSNMMLRIEVPQTRDLLLTVWGSFRCFSANSKCVSAIKPRSVECCSDVCPSVSFSNLHIWSWSSTEWPSGSWSPH